MPSLGKTQSDAPRLSPGGLPNLQGWSSPAERCMLRPSHICEAVKDYVSREILTGIQTDTEEHIDYLETQLDLVKRMGEQNHMQTAAGPIES